MYMKEKDTCCRWLHYKSFKCAFSWCWGKEKSSIQCSLLRGGETLGVMAKMRSSVLGVSLQLILEKTLFRRDCQHSYGPLIASIKRLV